MATRVGGTLKKIMLARIIANGSDFAARTVFTDEDIAAAAAESITHQQCLGWVRHFYERHANGDDRKLHLQMNELSDDEVRNE
jgi:hypothetical protein